MAVWVRVGQKVMGSGQIEPVYEYHASADNARESNGYLYIEQLSGEGRGAKVLALYAPGKWEGVTVV